MKISVILTLLKNKMVVI